MPNRTCHARYGQMIYPTDDLWIGRSYEMYGELCEIEADVYQRVVRPGDVVVEAGANIGGHTILFSKLVGNGGRVVAFEPQRLIYQMLCGNLAINSLENVWALQVALGDKEETASVETVPMNVGGATLCNASPGREVFPVQTLDQYHLPRVDFIKADVEGYEGKLLAGARETIDRCRPILYLENDRGNRQVLFDQVKALDYDVWWHETPLYNPNNHYHNPVNVFVSKGKEPFTYALIVSLNMLCVPKERNFAETLAAWDTAFMYKPLQ